MQKSNIPWCTHTWNPIVGCSKIATGCLYCYAEGLHTKRHKAYLAGKKLPVQYAKPFDQIQLFPDRLDDPLHCRAKDVKIFVCSMSDLFHERAPFEFIDRVFDTMFTADQHTYQILTKRPAIMAEYIEHLGDVCEEVGDPIVRSQKLNPNIWLGISMSTQADADKNIPALLQIPAAVRFVSVEPMLERVDFGSGYDRKGNTVSMIEELDWVIVGCESGPKRRPCKIEWIHDIANQCRAAKTKLFIKQASINGKCSKNPKEWPEDLRIQGCPRR